MCMYILRFYESSRHTHIQTFIWVAAIFECKQNAELIIYAQPNERRINATGLKYKPTHIHVQASTHMRRSMLELIPFM